MKRLLERLPYALPQAVLALLCAACTVEKTASRGGEETYDKAVLAVNWGLYSRSEKTINIWDRTVVAHLSDEFSRIKRSSNGTRRADWKPQGSLTFYRDGKQERKIILGISEWNDGDETELEYPLPKDLQTTLKEIASEEAKSSPD
jgi:hypothetical protein